MHCNEVVLNGRADEVEQIVERWFFHDGVVGVLRVGGGDCMDNHISNCKHIISMGEFTDLG